MTEDDELKVIPLRPSSDEPQGLAVVRSGNFCSHEYSILDDVLRTVRCKRCDALLDPFDTLLKWARTWDRYRDDRERCRREIAAAESRLAVLDRNERNARARARRAFDDLPDKNAMTSLVDGNIYVWADGGRVELGTNRKSMTPEEARAAARGLMRLAAQAEKQKAKT
jgi:hypothetical protein